jgi:hypothetical protein
MKKTALLTLSVLLAGCGAPGMVMAPLPAISDTAQAVEVAVIRPVNFIASEFPFYIAIGEQNVAPIRSGESVRFSLPSGRHSIAIRCLDALSPNFKETRFDYEFAPKGQAFFVVAPKFDCATIEPVDARAAGGLIANTRTRTVEQAKRLDYQGTSVAKAVAPAPSVAVAPPMTKALAQDAESVLKAREAALAARDLEALSGLFADDAVVVATNGRLLSGKEQIRPWLAEQVERRQREEAGPRASQGGKLTWLGKVYREDWQNLGVSPLYVTQEAIVEAGKIRFFNTSFTPESDARLRESRR